MDVLQKSLDQVLATLTQMFLAKLIARNLHDHGIKAPRSEVRIEDSRFWLKEDSER
jgi:hypothetical protein